MIPIKLVELTDPRLKCLSRNNRVFTSLEGENPGGSIKDRMVLGELQRLLKFGVIKEGEELVELSAGSTAQALAYYCQLLNIKCKLYVPETISLESLAKLEASGANIRKIEVESAFEVYEKETKPSQRFNQFFNKSLRQHFYKMWQGIERLINPDILIGSVGTGSSLYGMGEAASEKIRLLSAEPASKHMIMGVRNLCLESFSEREICDPNFVQRVVVQREQLFESSSIQTSDGLIQITPSFQLVLAALELELMESLGKTAFAIGASNYRIAQSDRVEMS